MMTEEESRNRTCEERIEEHYQGRMQQLRDLQTLMSGLLTNEIKDIIKIIDDVGYNWKDYTDLEENVLPWMAVRVFNEIEIEDLGATLINELPLEVTVEGCTVKVLLSWGGPSDYFLIHKNEATYHFQDWYDGARRLVDYADFQTLYDLWGVFMEENADCRR